MHLSFCRGVGFDMISKELKKLSRRELMDIIYQMKKNEQQMQDEITSLQEALQEKRVRLSTAGSIAEAAASITNVFSAAQKTADLYLHEISCMKEDTQKECTKIIEEANKTVARIYSDAEKRYAVLNERYQIDYKKWEQLQSEIEMLKKETADHKRI
jgi:cell division septum initiation protein DivIVA